MTAERPTMGEVLLLNKKDWRDMPDVNSPYYILAGETTYIHRRTAQGRGLVPTTKKPKQMPMTGLPHGAFIFDGAMIPASIYAQACHFFRRIFEKQHTEAEVIITQNEATNEYRLFVPTQQVSHGGVQSIYNPEHIARGYRTIGTFHSHCDFGSGHSGTDEGDARDFDGLHGTIGHVNTDPEMSLMYALNKHFFHFEPPFTNVVDISDLNAATAPEWWDRYVLNRRISDDERQQIAPYADDAAWDRFQGRKAPIISTPATRALTPYQGNGVRWSTMTQEERAIMQAWIDGEFDEGYSHGAILSESAEFNRRRRGSYVGPSWGKDGELTGSYYLDARSSDVREVPPTDDYWEDALGKQFIESLFNTELINESDVDLASANPEKSTTEAWWEGRMKNKLFRSVAWLRSRGIDITVRMDDKRIKPVAGQMTVDEAVQAQT